MDRANNVPSPLFLMVLPAEIEGTYILVFRTKFEALACNVIKGLAPFLEANNSNRSGDRVTTR